jgi:hypothetical protein
MHGRRRGLDLVEELSYCAWTAMMSIWSNTECSIAFPPPQACLEQIAMRLAV